MAVILETSLGDITIDLYTNDCPITTKNFLKLCKIKYYNNCLFHNIQKDYIIQTGDPTNTGKGGESIYGILFGEQAKFFEDEIKPTLKHKKPGTVAMASAGPNLNASQFYITVGTNIKDLDEKHTIFGEVSEGLDTVMKINEVYTNAEGRPLQVVRIKHTIILDDPFDDLPGLVVPDQSPIPPKEQWADLLDEEEYENIGKPETRTAEEIEEESKTKEAKSREDVLRILGDIGEDVERPPDNILFVCKLNPVTGEDDLEAIFSRFGEIRKVEVIRDWKTGDSLSYAFIEFANAKDCEEAYFKMDNVLIDDRRIHVDFSQSVSKQAILKDGRLARIRRTNQRSGASVAPRNTIPGNLELKETSRGQGNYDMVFEESSKKRKHSPDSDRTKEKARDTDRDRHRDRDRDKDRHNDKDKERGRERDKSREEGRNKNDKESKDRHTYKNSRDHESREREKDNEHRREHREHDRSRERAQDAAKGRH